MELVSSGYDVAAGTSFPGQKELVAACLRADSTAWEVMIRHHGPRIASQVYRYASLRGEAEDIKQEVFLKVFLNLSTFRVDDGNLGCWISRVGRNLIVDRLRRGKPRNSFVSEELESLGLSDHRGPNPESAAIRNEASGMLRKSIRFLSRELEEVLTLRYVREMSYDEIAEALQVPCGTVKSRLKRGREKLASVCRSGALS